MEIEIGIGGLGVEWDLRFGDLWPVLGEALMYVAEVLAFCRIEVECGRLDC
jgi:hypothetical protein